MCVSTWICIQWHTFDDLPRRIQFHQLIQMYQRKCQGIDHILEFPLVPKLHRRCSRPFAVSWKTETSSNELITGVKFRSKCLEDSETTLLRRGQWFSTSQPRENSEESEATFEASTNSESFNGGTIDSPKLVVVLNRIRFEAQQRARWRGGRKRRSPAMLAVLDLAFLIEGRARATAAGRDISSVAGRRHSGGGMESVSERNCVIIEGQVKVLHVWL